jgi:hypothetical protein
MSQPVVVFIEEQLNRVSVETISLSGLTIGFPIVHSLSVLT